MEAALLAQSHWIHDLSPFIWEFPESWQEVLPVEGIRFYGFAYLLGFVIAAGLLFLAWKKNRSPLDLDAIGSLMTALVIGVLLGGRLGFIFLYDFDEVLRDPSRIVRVWEGGMSSHGGFIGVALALLWFAWRRKIKLWHLADTVIAVCPPGLLLGRLANFVNGELWGRATDVPWAVIFPRSPSLFDPETGIFGPVARHPSQLYQAFLEGLILTIWLQWRFWRGGAKVVGTGRLVAEFLVFYSLFRFGLEFFREPDASLILGLTRGQFYSLIALGAGVWLWLRPPGKPNQSSK
jgi:phosphatidylglycerol:prolipoprotein diacylglycerol transferase